MREMPSIPWPIVVILVICAFFIGLEIPHAYGQFVGTEGNSCFPNDTCRADEAGVRMGCYQLPDGPTCLSTSPQLRSPSE